MLPYLAATCNGVNPFCRMEQRKGELAQLENSEVVSQEKKRLPLWPASVTLQPPAGRQLSPPGLPSRRCGGACSRWWWRHLGEPCAAAAAGRCQFSLDGTRCEGGSDPPVAIVRGQGWYRYVSVMTYKKNMYRNSLH